MEPLDGSSGVSIYSWNPNAVKIVNEDVTITAKITKSACSYIGGSELFKDELKQAYNIALGTHKARLDGSCCLIMGQFFFILFMQFGSQGLM